jgi:large subunit ribosomal protein L21
MLGKPQSSWRCGLEGRPFDPRGARRAGTKRRELSVYAIVRCGGRQEKASVDDVLTVDKLSGEVGASVTLPALLVVDDGKVISDPAELGAYQVTAEIVGAAAGPKINMIHYKNKTGYRRRLGHRQKYTQVRVIGIGASKASASKASASKPSASKPSASKASAPKASASKASAPKASAPKASASKASVGSQKKG